MCTAIAKINDDVIYGFNLDLDPAVWNYSVKMNRNYFSVAITVGKTTYLTHGVNAAGRFSNVPYMNGSSAAPAKGAKRERIDLITDRYIRGKYSFDDVKNITETKAVVSPPAAAMHSLVGDENGRMLIVEPGYGTVSVEENFAVLSNFPVLGGLTDFSNPFFGKDRYDIAKAALEREGAFGVDDALELLGKVKQGGKWGTRVSFVYSKNQNSVYYALEGNFEEIKVHSFG